MASYTSLAALVSTLKRKARIQSSEGFSDPSDLEDLVQEAIEQHNPAYEATSTVCTVPVTEKAVVVLLAWAGLCLTRASIFSTQPSTNQGGFQTDRNTPFYKCMELHKQLMAKYASDCATLGLQVYAASNSVAQSAVTCENLDQDMQTPAEISLAPAKPVLTLTQVGTTVTLSWTAVTDYNFQCFYVLCQTDGNEILEDWNTASPTGIPKVSDAAQIVATIYDATNTASRLVNVPTGAHFVVVAQTKSGKFSYSAELVAA